MSDVDEMEHGDWLTIGCYWLTCLPFLNALRLKKMSASPSLFMSCSLTLIKINIVYSMKYWD